MKLNISISPCHRISLAWKLAARRFSMIEKTLIMVKMIERNLLKKEKVIIHTNDLDFNVTLRDDNSSLVVLVCYLSYY